MNPKNSPSKGREIDWNTIIGITLYILMFVGILIYDHNMKEIVEKECHKFGMTSVKGDYTCMKIDNGFVIIYNLKRINGEYYLSLK
jgi:hypothetical protein